MTAGLGRDRSSRTSGGNVVVVVIPEPYPVARGSDRSGAERPPHTGAGLAVRRPAAAALEGVHPALGDVPEEPGAVLLPHPQRRLECLDDDALVALAQRDRKSVV